MLRMLKVVVLTMLGSVMLACGGGSGSESGSVSAQGLWIGSTNTNRAVTGLVLSDGTYYVLYSTPGNPGLIAGVIQGSGSSSRSSFSSDNARDFNLEGAGIQAARLSASVNPGQTINGNVTYSNGSVVAFSGAYDTDYLSTPSLATVSGTYTGQVALSVGVQSASFTVAANGDFRGAGQGCQFSGRVRPRSDANAYEFLLAFAGSPCVFANQTYAGIAYFNQRTRQLYAAAPNPTRSDGVLFVGVKR
jgi:hypothetical protein